MIQCAECESPQFLEIVASRIYFESKESADDGMQVEEEFRCEMCKSTGKYVGELVDGKMAGSVQGDVEIADPTIGDWTQ